MPQALTRASPHQCLSLALRQVRRARVTVSHRSIAAVAASRANERPCSHTQRTVEHLFKSSARNKIEIRVCSSPSTANKLVRSTIHAEYASGSWVVPPFSHGKQIEGHRRKVQGSNDGVWTMVLVHWHSEVPWRIEACNVKLTSKLSPFGGVFPSWAHSAAGNDEMRCTGSC